MARPPSAQRVNSVPTGRPEGGWGETGPSVSPLVEATSRRDVLVTLHQLVDALGQLPKVEQAGHVPAWGRDLPLLLNAVEASKLLSLSRTKVLDMATHGEIPSLRLGRSVRIPRDGLVAWIDERTKEPAWLRARKLPAWARADRSLER